MASQDQAEFACLRRLKSTDLPLWLTPNSSLSNDARNASVQLFSSLNPHCPKSPFDQLLIDGFDAEQIWQQIDLQSQSLLSTVKREVKRLEKSPEQLSNFFRVKEGIKVKKEALNGDVRESEDLDGFDDDVDDDLDVDMEDLEELDDDDDDDDDDEERESEESGGERESKKVGVEDEFLKIKELEEYIKEDEAREYGLEETGKKNKKEKKKKSEVEDSDDEEENEEEEEEDEDDELGEFGMGNEDDEDELENARYEDFFGSKKKKAAQRKPKRNEGSDEDATTSEDDDDIGAGGDKRKDNLSTHEKELLDLKSKVEQMEKANLEPKTWTMQGEVTATKRPKNSALEVDLDFEHNARPAPVITEEITASLEELIKKRVLEGHFDDVQKPPSLPSKAPKELKELDENKSKKGLAEIYEEEYAQKTNLASAPLSFSDKQKKEASLLFKRLCLKLDALSHFHFAPKPVIEDMSIQANVPALAMEEIAPLAVSDAAMLAPEEVFAGKGDIKDEAELTQVERKRRRAKKKRKHKAEEVKRMAAKKARETAMPNHNEGREE